MSDWITKDIWWKSFSIVLAVVIWLTVYKIREEPGVPTAAVAGVPLTCGNVPVLVVSTASDVRDFRVQPATVAVKVSGPPEVMAVLQANQIHPTVDLTGVVAARNLKRRVEVSTPPGVTLLNVSPEEVEVLFPSKSGTNP